jgi:hypothetical protein
MAREGPPHPVGEARQQRPFLRDAAAGAVDDEEPGVGGGGQCLEVEHAAALGRERAVEREHVAALHEGPERRRAPHASVPLPRLRVQPVIIS